MTRPPNPVLCPRPVSVAFRGKVPCGQCLPCRINVQRRWAGRILLEELSTGQSCFVTMTYREEDLPRDSEGRGILVKKHFQDFMKRLRRRFPDRKLRYVGVGEYGDRFWRPHYHAVIFGVHVLEEGQIEAAWGQGFVQVDEMHEHRAMYLAGYCTKKLTARAQASPKSQAFVDGKLRGRPPEFMLHSQGLGDRAIEDRALQYTTRHGSAALMATMDVAGAFRYRGRSWPFSYRHRQALRGQTGVPQKAHERQALGVAAGCAFTAEKIVRARYAETRLAEHARRRSKPMERGHTVAGTARGVASQKARSVEAGQAAVKAATQGIASVRTAVRQATQKSTFRHTNSRATRSSREGSTAQGVSGTFRKAWRPTGYSERRTECQTGPPVGALG